MYKRKLTVAFLSASFTSLLPLNSGVWERALAQTSPTLLAQLAPEEPTTPFPSPTASLEPSPILTGTPGASDLLPTPLPSPSVTTSPSPANPPPSVQTSPSVTTSPSPATTTPGRGVRPSPSPATTTPGRGVRPSPSPATTTPGRGVRPSPSPATTTPQPSLKITQPPGASPQASPQTSPTLLTPQPLGEPSTDVPSPAALPEPIPSTVVKQKQSNSSPIPLLWIVAPAIVLLLAGVSLFLVRKRSLQPGSTVPSVQPDVDFAPFPSTANQANGNNKPHLDIALDTHPDPGNQTLGFQTAIPGTGKQGDGIEGTLQIDLDIALATHLDPGRQTLKSPQGLVDGLARKATL